MKETKTTPAGPSKKEIRTKIQASVNQAIGEFHVDHPSKKVKKVVRKASKKLAKEVKQDIKSLSTKANKDAKKQSKKKKKSQPAV